MPLDANQIFFLASQPAEVEIDKMFLGRGRSPGWQFSTLL